MAKANLVARSRSSFTARDNRADNTTERARTRERRDASYWRSLSDEQLVKTAFSTADPSLLEGIIWELPTTEETPRVELAYNTKGGAGGGLVFCVHCRHETHNRGFVLRFEDSRRMLVGKDCGKKIYVADFDAIEKDFKGARERAGFLKLRNSITANKAKWLSVLASIKADPSLSGFRECKRLWNQTLPELAKVIGEVCAKGGELYINERVRDLAAEERREERQTNNSKQIGTMTKTAIRKARALGDLPSSGRPQTPIYKDILKYIGKLEGQEFLRIDHRLPDNRILELAARVEQILDALSQTKYSTAQYAVVFRDLRQLCEALVYEISRLHEIFDAFNSRNLSLIAQWATFRFEGRYIYSAGIGTINAATLLMTMRRRSRFRSDIARHPRYHSERFLLPCPTNKRGLSNQSQSPCRQTAVNPLRSVVF